MSVIRDHTEKIQVVASTIKQCTFFILAFFILINTQLLGQEKQLVQIKTFDQQLKPLGNIAVSINGKPYIDMGSKGVAFVELSESELSLQSVKVKDEALEAASWNYSKGIVEIMIRKKSYQLVHLYVRDAANRALSGLDVTFTGRKTLSATTDAAGKIEVLLALDEKIVAADQFKIGNYRILQLALSENENILTVEPVRVEPVAQLPDEKSDPIETGYFKDFDLSKIDSIQSFTVFYAIFKNYSVKDMSPEVKQKLDEKFNQLVQKLQDSIRREETAFIGRISDSSFVSDDIKNLLSQATLENETLQEQRRDFDEKIRLINEKLANAGDNLDEATRTILLSDLTLLERMLEENESRFYKNQNDYRTILNSLKEKFFHIEILENRLSESEAKRLEDQRLFRKRLFTILSIALVFALLIVLLIYFSNKLRKQKKALVVANDEVKRINENLEGLVNERTKLLKETNRELDLFLYRASHDLRSPVTSIIGLCNIASHIANSEAKELFEKAGQTASAMDRLLKKLRIISEINHPGDYSSIQLLPVIVEIKNIFNSFIQQHRINFTVSCAVDLAFYSNQNLIEAILFNLIENALFYSSLKNSPAPEVQVSVSIKNGHLEFIVYDNGIGVDSGIQGKLFDMFFKGHEQSKGNGLGLYIVQKSVHAIKGSVTIESEPNMYTRVIANIPIQSESEHKEQLQVESAEEALESIKD